MVPEQITSSPLCAGHRTKSFGSYRCSGFFQLSLNFESNLKVKYQEFLTKILKDSCSSAEFQWLEEKLAVNLRAKRLGFVMTPRFIPARPLKQTLLPVSGSDYSIDIGHWTLDQAARSLLLLNMDEGSPDEFHETIELLFQTAENREAAAIYKTIPLFAHPERWIYRATEAIRTNIGTIFDAMAFNNPFPAMHFDDTAWNQLVLKTIFGDKSIWNIIGLRERRNKELARAISDFAQERWSAGRTLSAEVWFLAETFPSSQMWNSAETLLLSEESSNRAAGFLLWKSNQNSAPAGFSERHQEVLEDMDSDISGWEKLRKINQIN